MNKRVKISDAWYRRVWKIKGRAVWLVVLVGAGCVVAWVFVGMWRQMVLPTSCSGKVVASQVDGGTSFKYTGSEYLFAFTSTKAMPWRLYKGEAEARTNNCSLVTYPQAWQDTEPWRSLPLGMQDWLYERFPSDKIDPTSLFRVEVKQPDGATLDEIAALYQRNWNMTVNHGRGGAVPQRNALSVSRRQLDGVEALVTSGTFDMTYQPMYVYSELITVLHGGKEYTFNWQASSTVSPRARDAYVAKHEAEVEELMESIKFLQ